MITLNYYYNSFLTKKNYEDVNILMFLTYTKIEFFFYQKYNYDFIIILLSMFY